MISKLVIVGLILVWAVVLLPDVVQRFSRGRRADTIRSFNSQLSSLGRSAPVAPLPPLQQAAPVASGDNVIDLRRRSASPAAPRHRPHQAPAGAPGGAPRAGAPRTGAPGAVSPAVRKRRQDVLVTLCSAAALTLLATVSFGGAFLYLHLFIDVLLAVYLVLLAQVGAASAAGPASAGARRDDLAPIDPLALSGGRRRGTVGRPQPFEPRRIAN